MLQRATQFYQDPFSPVLFSSEILAVSNEQNLYIREILEKSSSDSRFAQKAYDAIQKVLTGGSIKPTVVTSLTPNSIKIGDPSTTLHVHGSNFTNQSIIVFNGYEEPTTFVSDKEITTGINMDVWAAPVVVPVVVSTDGIHSNSMNFEFTQSGVQTASTKTPTKEEVPGHMTRK